MDDVRVDRIGARPFLAIRKQGISGGRIYGQKPPWQQPHENLHGGAQSRTDPYYTYAPESRLLIMATIAQYTHYLSPFTYHSEAISKP